MVRTVGTPQQGHEEVFGAVVELGVGVEMVEAKILARWARRIPMRQGL